MQDNNNNNQIYFFGGASWFNGRFPRQRWKGLALECIKSEIMANVSHEIPV